MPNRKPNHIPPSTHTAAKQTFFNSWLGIGMAALALVLPVLLGAPQMDVFLHPANMRSLFFALCYTGLLALAVALTSRANGPDVSVGVQMWMAGIVFIKAAAATGSIPAAVLITASVCVVTGAAIGILSAFLKLNALLITGIAASAILLACRLLTIGESLRVPSEFPSLASWVPGAVLLCVFAATGLLILLTRLRQPIHPRTNRRAPVYVLTYVLSGVLSAGAALLAMCRSQGYLWSPRNLILLLPVFIAGYIACSRLFDNGIMPAILALTGTAAWIVLQNALNLLSVSIYIQQAIQAVLIAIFGAVALVIWFAQRKAAKTAQ